MVKLGPLEISAKGKNNVKVPSCAEIGAILVGGLLLAIEMFNARQRIINDSALSPGDRIARVEKVTRRGSRLDLLLKRSS